MANNGNKQIVVGVGRGCDLEAVAVTEDTEVFQQAKAIASGYPEVRVRFVRTAGSPGPALVLAAREAALLVFGSHGHGRLAGALLGSVGAYCTAHAGCPVVVVPDPERVTQPVTAVDVDGRVTPGPLL